jgi:hypothetical protein
MSSLGALGLAYGYFWAVFHRLAQADHQELIRYLRRQHLATLFGRESI